MKRVAQTLAALAVFGVVAGGAVVGFGLYDVSARSGHLPGVSWLLHTTFRQSVKRQAPPASAAPDDLDDPDRIALGARHFDAACRVCHSAPGHERTATMLAMVPEPPHIADAVAHWRPRHLHWIVYDGVKMSGMPHWPSTRKDDVWHIVAFLTAARGMTRDEYDALVRTPGEPGAALGACMVCHGEDGRSGAAHIPRLDIQSRDYLERTLREYRDGGRQSGIMRHAASEVSEDALADLAEYFAAKDPAGDPAAADAALIEAGRALAMAGDDDAPACKACHGPRPTRTAAEHPEIAGQYAAYLETQLRLWREGPRGGGERADLMVKAAQGLTDDDIAALAAFYASLPIGDD